MDFSRTVQDRQPDCAFALWHPLVERGTELRAGDTRVDDSRGHRRFLFQGLGRRDVRQPGGRRRLFADHGNSAVLLVFLLDAFIIGIAQACAVLPGLSRSGSTIGTGLILGDKKEKLAQFSFLMVIPPILGEALLDVKKIAEMGVEAAMAGISTTALVVGFLAAFVTGCLACRWMIGIVRKGKLIYFAIYCAIVGIATLIWQLL